MTKRRPTALIADDEPLLREALARQLADAWPELEIVAEARNGREVVRLFDAKHPDICFLDMQMPGLSGVEAARHIGRRAHLVFVTAYDHYAVQAFAEGALDYLVKPVSPDDLAAAADQNVRVVKARRYVEYARQQVVEIADLLARTKELLGPTGYGVEQGDSMQRLPLSDREEEIARALLKGHRVSHIASMLDISPHTVRNHFKSIFRKMQVHSQVELLARLREEFEGK